MSSKKVDRHHNSSTNYFNPNIYHFEDEPKKGSKISNQIKRNSFDELEEKFLKGNFDNTADLLKNDPSKSSSKGHKAKSKTGYLARASSMVKLNPENNMKSPNKLKKSLSFLDTDQVGSILENEGNFYAEETQPKIADYTRYTNEIVDRDDSLFDVISFGKQTPFRSDHNNLEDSDDLEKTDNCEIDDFNLRQSSNQFEKKVSQSNASFTLEAYNNNGLLNIIETYKNQTQNSKRFKQFALTENLLIKDNDVFDLNEINHNVSDLLNESGNLIDKTTIDEILVIPNEPNGQARNQTLNFSNNFQESLFNNTRHKENQVTKHK